MKRYGNLFDQVVAFSNLLDVTRKAQRGKRDRRDVARFLFHLEPELFQLQDELRAGTYRMQPYRPMVIYEPKERHISVAAFRDRVVHHAICNVLDPIFEACLVHDTYACRRGKGTHAAVKRAQTFARRLPYVLKCDIRKYFESIDHTVLKALLRRKLKDQRLLLLLDQIIAHPIPAGVSGRGVPIGNLTSQYFANFYLGELDHFVKERLRIKGYVRYMDDVLVFAASKPELHEILAAIRTYVQHALRLELKEEALRLMPVTQGIPFLGFRIFPGMVRLQRKQWGRFKRKVREREAQFRRGEIDEETLGRSVASLIGHTLHADTLAARRAFFASSLALG